MSAVCRPYISRISAVYPPYIRRMSAVCQPYISCMSAVYPLYVSRLSAVERPYVSRISAVCQPYIRRMSAIPNLPICREEVSGIYAQSGMSSLLKLENVKPTVWMVKIFFFKHRIRLAAQQLFEGISTPQTVR